jgi:hypothetical protein
MRNQFASALRNCRSDAFENESDAGTHRTPKALRAKYVRAVLGFAEAFGVRRRPPRLRRVFRIPSTQFFVAMAQIDN